MNVVIEVAENSTDRSDLVVKVDWSSEKAIQNAHEVRLLSFDLQAHVSLILVDVKSNWYEDHKKHIRNITVDALLLLLMWFLGKAWPERGLFIPDHSWDQGNAEIEYPKHDSTSLVQDSCVGRAVNCLNLVIFIGILFDKLAVFLLIVDGNWISCLSQSLLVSGVFETFR